LLVATTLLLQQTLFSCAYAADASMSKLFKGLNAFTVTLSGVSCVGVEARELPLGGVQGTSSSSIVSKIFQT